MPSAFLGLVSTSQMKKYSKSHGILLYNENLSQFILVRTCTEDAAPADCAEKEPPNTSLHTDIFRCVIR